MILSCVLGAWNQMLSSLHFFAGSTIPPVYCFSEALRLVPGLGSGTHEPPLHGACSLMAKWKGATRRAQASSRPDPWRQESKHLGTWFHFLSTCVTPPSLLEAHREGGCPQTQVTDLGLVNRALRTRGAVDPEPGRAWGVQPEGPRVEEVPTLPTSSPVEISSTDAVEISSTDA